MAGSGRAHPGDMDCQASRDWQEAGLGPWNVDVYLESQFLLCLTMLGFKIRCENLTSNKRNKNKLNVFRYQKQLGLKGKYSNLI